MRTNIVLDDELIHEALALSHIKTKRELVELALREVVAFRKRLDVRELKGMGGIRGLRLQEPARRQGRSLMYLANTCTALRQRHFLE